MDMGSTMMMERRTAIDFFNETDAADFLAEILDDTVLQVVGNMYTRDFWYGVCTVISICAFFNLVQKATIRARYVEFVRVHWLPDDPDSQQDACSCS